MILSPLIMTPGTKDPLWSTTMANKSSLLPTILIYLTLWMLIIIINSLYYNHRLNLFCWLNPNLISIIINKLSIKTSTSIKYSKLEDSNPSQLLRINYITNSDLFAFITFIIIYIILFICLFFIISINIFFILFNFIFNHLK